VRGRGCHDGWFRIYDISGGTQPKLIHDEKTCGCGVHRGYISMEMEGCLGNILMIRDISILPGEEVVRRGARTSMSIPGG
jgi:hypothetical protein